MPYLTPDIDDLNGSPDCRTITVSGDLWLYVSGALSELEKVWNWEEAGTATPEQMADYFKTISDDYATSQCGGGSMNYVSPATVLVNTNQSEGITVWSVLAADLPEGATGVLLQVSISPTANGTFVGGGLGLTPGIKGATTESVTPSMSFFQFLCPVAEQGIRFQITGMGATWSIIVSLVAYL